MAGIRMLVLGDSVPWGQGLQETDKYDVLVEAALTAEGFNVDRQRLAHSGAVIGENAVQGQTGPGEVPCARPTIIEQCDSFADSPESITVILANGGINDVDIRTILNPLVPEAVISGKIQAFCHDSLLALLKRIKAKFTHPQCRILVTGYYPILSHQSDPPFIPKLMALHGIAGPPFLSNDPLIACVVAHCQQFFAESTINMKRAVADVADARFSYVDLGFSNSNSVFAPDAFLWELNDDLSPQDEVAAQRHASCDISFNAFDVLDREQCYRASAGHPNVSGARQIAKQNLLALDVH